MRFRQTSVNEFKVVDAHINVVEAADRVVVDKDTNVYSYLSCCGFLVCPVLTETRCEEHMLRRVM